MAYTVNLTREKTYELLELTINNCAKPVMIIEDNDGVAHEIFIELLFADRKDTAVFNYGDFIMSEAFSVSKIAELSKLGYIIVEDVKHLYGKSATSKILVEFVSKMQDAGVGVIFTGKRVIRDMAEFIEQADGVLQYIIELEPECY